MSSVATIDIAALERELGPEGLARLRDELLAKLPPEPGHPTTRTLTRKEQADQRAQERADAVWAQSPPHGPVADTVAAGERQAAEREALYARLRLKGRFSVVAYEAGRWKRPAWRVVDGLTGRALFLALADPMKPVHHEGFACEADALAVVEVAKAYFNRIGIPGGVPLPIGAERASIPFRPAPPAPEPDDPLLPNRIWLEVEKLIPVRPPAPAKPKCGQRPGRQLSDRQILRGIVFIIKAGLAWDTADIPSLPMTGPYYRRRLVEWQQAGAWPAIEAMLKRKIRQARTWNWSRATVSRGGSIARAWQRHAEATASLLVEVEAYLDWSGDTAAELGAAVGMDPSFLTRMRLGRGLMPKPRAVLARYIRSELEYASGRQVVECGRSVAVNNRSYLSPSSC